MENDRTLTTWLQNPRMMGRGTAVLQLTPELFLLYYFISGSSLYMSGATPSAPVGASIHFRCAPRRRRLARIGPQGAWVEQDAGWPSCNIFNHFNRNKRLHLAFQTRVTTYPMQVEEPLQTTIVVVYIALNDINSGATILLKK